MVDTRRKPWYQLPDEPLEAFAKFECYRNLGPGRSLHKAYAAMECVSKEKLRDVILPGNWCKMASEWDWVERATRWDIHVFQMQGRTAVAYYGRAVAIVARKTYLAAKKHNPKDWKQVLEGVNSMDKLISQEVTNAFADAADVGTGDESDKPVSSLSKPPGELSGPS